MERLFFAIEPKGTVEVVLDVSGSRFFGEEPRVCRGFRTSHARDRLLQRYSSVSEAGLSQKLRQRRELGDIVCRGFAQERRVGIETVNLRCRFDPGPVLFDAVGPLSPYTTKHAWCGQ